MYNTVVNRPITDSNTIGCFSVYWCLTYCSPQKSIAEKCTSQGQNGVSIRNTLNLGLPRPEARNCLHGTQIIDLRQGENTCLQSCSWENGVLKPPTSIISLSLTEHVYSWPDTSVHVTHREPRNIRTFLHTCLNAFTHTPSHKH